MNQSLEHFTHKNKEAFDHYTPSPKVWDKVQKSSKHRKHLPTWIKYASVAVVVFTLGFGVGQWNDSESQNLVKMRKLPQIEQQQIIENEYYYLTKINEGMQELKPYFARDPRLQKDVTLDFKELDDYCTSLKKDLQDDINNTEVIEALVQSYQTKLYILEGLLQQLKNDSDEEQRINL